MEYHKLVRDRIPEIINNHGKRCVYRIAEREEYLVRLLDKLREEVEEFVEDPSEEELADIHEVLDQIQKAYRLHGFKAEQISKRIKKGAFEQRIVLESVED
jgi:predicted house-cleaning noncanonical NTP pyrophosphatase (MazG superfamily)